MQPAEEEIVSHVEPLPFYESEPQEVQEPPILSLQEEEITEEESSGSETVDFGKLSEALGHFLVRNLNNPNVDFDLQRIIAGMHNEKAGLSSPMTEEEYEQTISQIQEEIFLNAAEQNLQEAVSFLENNHSEEGVLSLNDKLQYKIACEGEGLEVAPDSTPLVHYTGKLLDGTTFVNSHETGEPISLPLKQTIPGFSKGLVGMREGEKRILYIHPELAFGVSGYLPPNSLLIFEVEVVKANSAEEAVAIDIPEQELEPIVDTCDGSDSVPA